MAEVYFVETAEMTGGDFSVLLTRPICLVLWICIALALAGSRYTARLGRS